MEFFLTIISAVIIFILGQMSLKLIIEPIQELKKEIAEVLNAMVFYADRTSNPNTNSQEVIDEVGKILRKHASNLEAKSSIIPFYKIFEILRVLPSKDNISKAKSFVIGLSNSLGPSKYNSGIENSKRAGEVKFFLTTYSSSGLFEIIIVLIIVSVIVFLFHTAIYDAVKLYCEHNVSGVIK